LLSDSQFQMIPGIEFSCVPAGLHVLGVGVTELTTETDAVPVARHIRACNGFAVLAHPKRQDWRFSPELWQSVDAVEIWNVGYDGKYLPRKQSLERFRSLRRDFPHLMAVAAHDLHQPGGYYPVAIEMEVEVLSLAAVLEELRKGRFALASRWFHCGSSGTMRWYESMYLGILGTQLNNARSVRRWLRAGA
jgi:hypothetical protein